MIQTSKPSTVYFFVGSISTTNVDISDVKRKTLLRDYYAHDYILGEYITDDPQNLYSFSIKGKNFYENDQLFINH
jgi:hypothetical protein